jgi:NAD(P)-dependent dehydrogenase (short-subunit alcohol dehydrogenase family)
VLGKSKEFAMTVPSISIPEPQPFDSLLSLKGRCAVVTGGSRGLGEAIVHRFSQAGAAVVLTGRGVDALKSVESKINAAGGQALGVQADHAKKLRTGTLTLDEVPEDAVETRKKMRRFAIGGAFVHALTSWMPERMEDAVKGFALEKLMGALMPLGRTGYPDEIAKAVLFLASDMGSYVSGTNIVADGAQSLR